MLKKSNLILIILFLAGISPVLAQSIYDKTITQLTNNNSKQWVYEKTDSYTGNKKCSRWQKWKFYKNGTVTIVKCINKEIVETEPSWSLEVKSAYDLILKVGSTTYTLKFPLNSPREMILREKAPTPIDETNDLIFYYEKD